MRDVLDVADEARQHIGRLRVGLAVDRPHLICRFVHAYVADHPRINAGMRLIVSIGRLRRAFCASSVHCTPRRAELQVVEAALRRYLTTHPGPS